MCLIVYPGSSVKLRERKGPFISVEALNSDQAVVRKYFPEPNVCFIGSHSGCSCGFPSVIAETPIEYFDQMFSDPTPDRDNGLASVRDLPTLRNECLDSKNTCTLIPFGYIDRTLLDIDRRGVWCQVAGMLRSARSIRTTHSPPHYATRPATINHQ